MADNAVFKQKLKFYKEGCFLNAYENDAILLHELFNYKIYTVGSSKIAKIGFPWTFAIRMKEILESKNYIVEFYEQERPINIVREPEFENNPYEFFECLLNGFNFYTGEVVTGIDTTLKKELENMYENIKKTVPVHRSYGRITWTYEQVEAVKELCNIGWFAKNIAHELKLELSVVRKIMRMYGLSRRLPEGRENMGARWSEEEDKQLIEEYGSGMSIRNIALMHKRKAGGVRARLKKHGLLKY